MKKWQNTLAVISRLFISPLFILSAIDKILDWQNTERGFMNVLLDWQGYTSFSVFFQKIFSTALEWVPAVLLILTVMEILGGLLVFFGVKVRLGVFLLLLFILPITPLFHPFWFLSGLQREMQMILFLKNIAIIGGLLQVFAWGGKIKSKKLPIPTLPPSSSMKHPSMTNFPSSPGNKDIVK